MLDITNLILKYFPPSPLHTARRQLTKWWALESEPHFLVEPHCQLLLATADILATGLDCSMRKEGW